MARLPTEELEGGAPSRILAPSTTHHPSPLCFFQPHLVPITLPPTAGRTGLETGGGSEGLALRL